MTQIQGGCVTLAVRPTSPLH